MAQERHFLFFVQMFFVKPWEGLTNKMKNLNFLVPNGQSFQLAHELFLIEKSEVDKITSLGLSVNRFMSAMQAIVYVAENSNMSLPKPFVFIRKLLSNEINVQHKKLFGVHPHRNSLVTRVDFMVDESGNLKIAEIDPMNKHGLGFALSCRNESGHGERQKILSFFSDILKDYTDLSILISRKDEFFHQEQIYFAQKLSEYTCKPVYVFTEKDGPEISKRIDEPSSCFLDCPVVEDAELNQKLIDVFTETPKRFLMPPKHWMANKALMSFVHEPEFLGIISAFLHKEDVGILRQYIPPTFITNPKSEGFVVKKVLSSGAKGVFFNGNAPDKNVVYQEYVPQKKFILGGKEQYIRLAAHFVGTRLAELTVTSTNQIPVHGGSQSINYHVGLKT